MRYLYTAVLMLTATLSTAFAQTYTATLSGQNETHLVTTMATGMIEANLNGNDLTVTGTFSNLSAPVATEIAGGAHIHMALAGSDGPVALVLQATLDSDMRGGSFEASDNTFELTAEQVDALQNRMLYVNIHTETFTAGELRGQLVPQADQVFRVTLTGNNESEPIVTTASGALIIELNDHDITVSGSFSGLMSDLATEIAGGAHIHMGFTGMNGDVVKVLDVTTSGGDLRNGQILASNNMFNLSHPELVALLGRQLYVNIHSESFPAGELRGQILSDSRAHFQANLSGLTETIPVNSSGWGAVNAELIGDQLVVTGSFSGLSSGVATEIAGGVHIHMGMPGRDGDVKLVLQPTLSSDGLSGTFPRSNNTFTLEPEVIDALFGRMLYVNIHSEMFNAGELRGQLLPVARTYLTANLSGLNEVTEGDAVQSPGNGLVLAELTGNRLSVSGTFNGLSSALATEIAGGAHIHMGDASVNGGVEFVLNIHSSGDMISGMIHAEDNTFELTEQQIEALLGGMLYVNIHSEEVPSGELRGQLLPDIVFYPELPMIESPGEGAEITLSEDASDPVTIAWQVVEDRAGFPVVYLWQASTDSTFSSSEVFVFTGSDPMFNTTSGEIDMVLENAGVEPGQSVTLYHRAWSSNGSAVAPGPFQTAVFTRPMTTSIDEGSSDSPYTLRLEQNFPNPFNPGTQIRFEIPQSDQVALTVYDITGRKVAELVNGMMSAGTHTVQFDASELSSGMYIYRLSVGGTSLVNKMTLVK